MFKGNETGDEIRARRATVKKEYGQLFDTVSEILFRHDPIGINFDDNIDEYNPEAETILPRLRSCSSIDDVLTIVHEEFQEWFNGEAGSKKKYTKVAEEIWSAWLKMSKPEK